MAARCQYLLVRFFFFCGCGSGTAGRGTSRAESRGAVGREVKRSFLLFDFSSALYLKKKNVRVRKILECTCIAALNEYLYYIRGGRGFSLFSPTIFAKTKREQTRSKMQLQK